MRLYTILKNIINGIVSMKSNIVTKQNKAWKNLGNSAGTLKINASGYSELKIFAAYGGVYAGTIVPVSMLNASPKLFFVGYYGNDVLVSVTTTEAKMYRNPTGYTATVHVYAR